MEYICIKECESKHNGKTYNYDVGDIIFYYHSWPYNFIFLGNQWSLPRDYRTKGYVRHKFIAENFEKVKTKYEKEKDDLKTLNEVNKLFENLMA